MLHPDLLRHLAGIGAAAAGAALFHLIGFPAAPLTGSAVAVSMAALAGAKIPLPRWLLGLFFMALGINIGTAVTPEVLQTALNWPQSIAILYMALTVSLFAALAGLIRVFGHDRLTALLASAPGHLSFVLGLAAEGGAGVTQVALIQSIRVLFLTLCVPALVTLLYGGLGQALPDPGLMQPPHMAVILALTWALALLFLRYRVPVAWLLAGMLVSAAGHVTGLTPGRLPDQVVTLALIAMGALIGSRFSGVSLRDLRAAIGGGLWVTLVNVSVTLLAVVLAAQLFDLPIPMLIVAFAPGGVEAMAAIALVLSLDPAFVAAHHVSRLVLLSFLVPALVAWITRRAR